MSLVRGDARHIPLRDASVQCVVTSPPYWGLRYYDVPPLVWGGQAGCKHVWIDGFCPKHHCGAWRGQLGLEPTPDLFVAHLVEVFAEVSRVLKPDGVLWLNLGDCYATGAGAVGEHPGGGAQGARWRGDVRQAINGHGKPQRGYKGDRGGHEGKHGYRVGPQTQPNRLPIPGLKPKDLVGIPWRVAFALQADGWYLRSDIIWSKPNPMPESVTDRPTKAHEYLFLLTRSEKYYYDGDAIKEPYAESTLREIADGYDGEATKDYDGAGVQNPSDTKRRIIEGARRKNDTHIDHRKHGVNEWDKREPSGRARLDRESHHGRVGSVVGRNKRSVWTVPTQPYSGAHFATFPEKLIEPCILAGCPVGGLALDPFMGSGTVGAVAERLGRQWVGIDLSYHDLAKARTRQAGLRFATA